MPFPSRTPQDDDPDRQRLWRLSGMGMNLLGYIAGAGFLGYLLDRWWGTSPWATVVGAGLGVVMGMVDFIRQATKLSTQASREYRRDHPYGSPPIRDDDEEPDDDA